MKRLIGLLPLLLLCAGVLVGLPALASAKPNTTTCTGTLAAGSYQKVVVPDDAVCFAETPVTIRGGLFIGSGATFVLGDEEHPGDNGTITGGVHATGAMNVQIHFMRIDGGVDIQGGAGPFGGPFGVTWNTIEDSWINGTVRMEGYDGFWAGFIRNHVKGTVNLNDNVLVDEDGNEYVTNVIQGSLKCSGNSPAPQIGDSEGSPNTVTGTKTGQCAGL
jgi:hypothetical protein